MGPFDYIKALSVAKDVAQQESISETQLTKEYVPFLTNRAFSYHLDTLNLALRMNTVGAHLPPKLQYDFYLTTVRPRARYGAWAKPVRTEQMEAIAQFYNVSLKVASTYADVLTKEQQQAIVDQIKERDS